ncbi:ABC transporter permease [Nocardioides houyundeii]|uniref:ABC transporter permease n=1 Tax=Nocardioides houyundeii TaxID=2045452 RepID=UPI000DF3C5A9|nr:ABC transporter permease [Nocardioides houyundeii]
MSATTASHTLDVSGTRRTPFTRLVSVELRKMADTRAGIWLLAAIALITVAIILIVFFNTDSSDRTFFNFMGATSTPQGFLLPVLGILLVTSEWNQRTTLTTFTLEPSRVRVIAAKTVAATIFGLGAIVVACLIALVAALVGGANDAFRDIAADDFGKFAILQLLAVLQGVAFGVLFLNSAAAIVAYFVLPIAFTVVAQFWGTLNEIAAWVDLGTAQVPLFNDGGMTGEEWAQLGSVTLLWVVLPFAVGLWRVLRSEMK